MKPATDSNIKPASHSDSFWPAFRFEGGLLVGLILGLMDVWIWFRSTSRLRCFGERWSALFSHAFAGQLDAAAGGADGGVQQEVDTSGTNPAVLKRTRSVSNEYRFLDNDGYFDLTNFRYSEPFLDGRAALRLTVPFDGTDVELPIKTGQDQISV
jgi:hypothetical protein